MCSEYFKMGKPLLVLIFSNGRMCEGEEGVKYDGPPPKSILIKRETTISGLKRRIHLKLKLQPNQVISRLQYRFPEWCNVLRWIALPLEDDEDIACMIDSYEQYPNIASMQVYVEVETIEDHVNVIAPSVTCIEAGPSRDTSIYPINTQLSMAQNDPIHQYQEVNIVERHEPFHTSYIAEVTPVEQCEPSSMYNVTNHEQVACDLNFASENPIIRDALSDTSEDEGVLPDSDDSDTDIEGDFDANENLEDPPRQNIPMTSSVPSFVMPTHNAPTVTAAPVSVFMPPSPMFSNIDWDVLRNPDLFPELVRPGTWSSTEELYIGLQFPTKEAVNLALKHYSLRRHQSYKVEESDSRRLSVKCPRFGNGCNWRVRAILGKKSNVWQITKYDGPHTCVNPALSQDHTKLDSDMICSCILDMVSVKPDVPISLIIERIKAMFSYKVSYRKAWKAKQKAIVKVFGDWEKSYHMLPRWLGALQMYMEGTVVEIQTNHFVHHNRVDPSKQMLHRLFWTFKPCVDGFPFCKPIIQVDGTHLYGKYRHKLLIATTQDGDRHPLPLAFAIVEGETKDAWSWFLGCIRTHVTQQQGLCLISDRHASILEAVRNPHLGWQPPHAYHVFCIRHIASNFNSRFKNVVLKKHLINTGTFHILYLRFHFLSNNVSRN